MSNDHSLFPHERPPVSVTPLDEAAFPVDCPELRWWFLRPAVGEEKRWAIYEYDAGQGRWLRGSVTHMRVTAPAEIHGVEGVEIEVLEEPGEEGASRIVAMYARLTGDAVGWLAVMREDGGKRVLTTFLDEGFEEDWGGLVPRRIGPETAAGAWEVTVGERSFRCLRVIDVGRPPSETDVLIEAFLDERGRTVLARRYNGRDWARERHETPWDQRLPHAQRLQIDGATFVHWYDCVTDVALSG